MATVEVAVAPAIPETEVPEVTKTEETGTETAPPAAEAVAEEPTEAAPS
ncbi:hypothetical protein OIU77_018209 [Salix suchowensis]|uniref:Arabinogalactan 4 n=1 Tax=Salix suchowensis TaxID=1278906 RepID=A0ABQ8ZRG2_9ROSI|nr:hypothetical protein OIU77_018209 [Salix suchowensis]